MPRIKQQFEITDTRLPADHLILEGVDVSREPVFTVSEVARFFFARTAHWVRWRERRGFFVLDGEPVGERDTLPNGKLAARSYNLADVEKMAHALASKGAINGAQLANALLLVKTEAKLWGHIE